MALFKCSECGKEISDKAAFCPHCGCPVAQTATTPNNSPQTNTPTIIEHKPKVPKKRNKALPFAVVGGVIVIAIIAILISGLLGGGKGSVATDGISNVTDSKITGGTETELAIIIDVLSLTRDEVLSVFPNAEDEDTRIIIPGTFAGSTGIYKAFISSGENDVYQMIFERDSDKYDADAVVDEICNCLGKYVEYDAEWNEYEWRTNELELLFYVDERVYFYEGSSSTKDDSSKDNDSENNQNEPSDNLTLSSDSIDDQFAAFQSILTAVSCDDILSSFTDASTSDSKNITIDGNFCNVDGTYVIYCWNDTAYQINFAWSDSSDVDMDDIVDTVNTALGKYARNYEYWGIFEWEKDNIKVSVDPEDGVIVEKVYDDGQSDLEISTATVDRTQYMNLSAEEVDYDIGVVKTLMSYREKPKHLIYEKYPDAVDDDWNQLLFAGTIFGIDGRFCIMYDRETGLVTGLGFDWIPDDRETHDNHFVYCLELYFGECQETDKFYYGDTTYYQYDWDGSTIENWSVHLSTTKDTGWLQFSQLAAYAPDDDNLPEERPEADDYDEFIDVITECFRYIPDCDLYFGSEDTGSPNSYTIKVDGDIIGIFGIELDSYDMISMIDPDKDDADLHHEQMAIAMIMSLDADKTYEDAREIFEAAEGDYASFGAGIYCFEGMDSGMKAFGIDITWLS